jgi:hypothetical protein
MPLVLLTALPPHHQRRVTEAMTAKKPPPKPKPAPYQQCKPIITLLPTDAGREVFGFARLDILAFNVDGAGKALCRTFDDAGTATLTLQSNELGVMLEAVGDEIATIEAPENWMGERPAVLDQFDGGYVGEFDDMWSRPYTPWGSDMCLKYADHDGRAMMLAERRGYPLFDRCLAKLKLPPRKRGDPPYAYGDREPRFQPYVTIMKAWRAAKKGDKKRCKKMLRRWARKHR